MSRHGEFSPDPPETRWLTEPGPDRNMRVLKEFWFRDPSRKIWSTPAEWKIDGSSIPRALWTLVGSPYTGDYRRASIVHDEACDDATGNAAARRKADKMFYHGCREGGCSIFEATLLYIGVRIGALTPHVNAWNEESTRYVNGPNLARTYQEERIEADFRATADRVMQQGETDDAEEVERRTDVALASVTGWPVGKLQALASRSVAHNNSDNKSRRKSKLKHK